MIIEFIMQVLSQKKGTRRISNQKRCYPFILKTSFLPRPK